MVERYKGETILASWVADADDLRNFAPQVNSWWKRIFLPSELRKEYEKISTGAAIEVVFREDAFFVGRWGCSSHLYDYVLVHDTWMQFIGDEGSQIPVPLARGAKADAERIAAHYAALDTRTREASARQFAEERAKPTPNNRLLHFVEAHLAWLLLGVFVLLPLFMLAISFLT